MMVSVGSFLKKITKSRLTITMNCLTYSSNIVFFADDSYFVKQKPGIRFTEKMVGTYTESSKEISEEIPCEFTLTIESDDVESMLNCDPSHSAKIVGTVTCPALSSTPLTVSEGMFNLKAENVMMRNYRLCGWRFKYDDYQIQHTTFT